MRKLNDEERKFIVEHLGPLIKDCKHEEVSLFDSFELQLQRSSGSFLDMLGDTIPCVITICKRCFMVNLHAFRPIQSMKEWPGASAPGEMKEGE